jgi:hypothetical protein
MHCTVGLGLRQARSMEGIYSLAWMKQQFAAKLRCRTALAQRDIE